MPRNNSTLPIDVAETIEEILDLLGDEINPRTQQIEVKLAEVVRTQHEIAARQARTETMLFKLAMHLGIRPRTGERYCDDDTESR